MSRIVTSLVATLLLTSIALNFYFAIVFAASLQTTVTETVYEEGDPGHRIAILPIQGLVDDEMAAFARDVFKQIEENPPAALILRVDSGGGYVGSSDRIWHDLVTMRARLAERGHTMPVIASFGSTAASGAYYVSAPADLIFAEPTTMTGSIGVIAQAFTVQELLGKIGVTPEVITSTESTKKDELSPTRAWTPEDRAKLREMLDSAYNRFVKVVHEGRSASAGMTLEQAQEVATGEVFTAEHALQLKLVDREGYLSDAIEAARVAANMPSEVRPHVVQYGQPASFGMLGLLGTSGAPGIRLADIDAEVVRGTALELSAPRLMYYGGLK